MYGSIKDNMIQTYPLILIKSIVLGCDTGDLFIFYRLPVWAPMRRWKNQSHNSGHLLSVMDYFAVFILHGTTQSNYRFKSVKTV